MQSEVFYQLVKTCLYCFLVHLLHVINILSACLQKKIGHGSAMYFSEELHDERHKGSVLIWMVWGQKTGRGVHKYKIEVEIEIF